MLNEKPAESKFARFKKWTVEHADVITAVTVFGGFATLVVGTIVYAEHEVRKTNEYIREETNAGNNVYELASGSLISVPRTADIKIRN